MSFGPRRLFIHVAVLGLLARGLAAWAQSACTPSPQCRRDCGPTHAATEGPFYVANAPELVDINPARAQGTTMRIEGTVYSQDAVTPIRAARVEIWHADALGAYHPQGHGDIASYRRSEINLRGVGHTDALGRFAFASIVPGHYGDRRRHIHWKISAPGHRTVTTQSYWLDERGSARDQQDGTDRRPEACRWVAFKERDGAAVGVFDVVLETLS